MSDSGTKTIRYLLSKKPFIQTKLYTNGFLISNKRFQINNDYPFYDNWVIREVGSFYIHLHKDAKCAFLIDSINSFFIIGHAVDPFSKLYKEEDILKKLQDAFNLSADKYYSALGDLTGIYCTGIINREGIYITNDCTGMQIVYYGVTDGLICITSHSKLAGDLMKLDQTSYIKRLVSSRFYHYMGTWLPGDLSPYNELRRLVPNHILLISKDGSKKIKRIFPTEPIVEESEEKLNETVAWLKNTIHDTLDLYAEKWADKKVSISVTGGRDSTTTLACANGLYEKFSYFSYVSNDAERIDAIAADKICRSIGLEHSVYYIPDRDSDFDEDELVAFAHVLEWNAGCIGKNNANDVRKRLFFINNPDYDVEIKSWVNELGRGSQYVKYNKTRFPGRPKASYCRALHKIYVSPKLIHDTDKVFSDYLQKYYPEEVLSKAPWMELFWWEFCWSGGEGLFMTAEHRVSSEIAIPFNNRRYIATMLQVPLEKRKSDYIPISIITLANSRIGESGVVVKNLKHTDKRALLMRLYLEIFSRIHF